MLRLQCKHENDSAKKQQKNQENDSDRMDIKTKGGRSSN